MTESARLRELLAEAAHDLWCEWMSYYLRGYFRCRWTENDYDRWDRLAHTPYSELTERERASDRDVSSRLILPAIQSLLDRVEAAERQVADLEAHLDAESDAVEITGRVLDSADRKVKALQKRVAELEGAAQAIFDYEETGGPLYLDWDRYYDRLRAALRGEEG
jgi:hypothetical protein